MATIKSYTDLQQSKKLAEILPLESADMVYVHTTDLEGDEHYDIDFRRNQPLFEDDVCAWSLAALLGVLPKIVNNETLFIETSAALWHVGYRNIYIARADNPIDACYKIIIRLNELKML